MAELTGGEAIVKSLLQHEVDTLFGLPGVQNDYLYNALYDEGGKIRVIHTRHEQGAAYMALGYALAQDKPGVYSVVPGAGFLNTTAALATAYGANARVLCLTGQIPTPYIGQGYGLLHEIPDQMGVLRSLTKWAASIESPTAVPGIIAEAYQQLYTGRPRPVGVECAMDVLAAKADVLLGTGQTEINTPPLNTDLVEEAAKRLGRAKSPVIFVGSGAMHAAAEVQQLAEMLQAPVVAYSMGRGILSSRHYLHQFLPAGYELWQQADAVLAIGTRLSMPLMRWNVPTDGKLIRIDIDPEEHARYAPAAVNLVADAQEALEALIELVARYNQARPSREADMQALRAKTERLTDRLEPQKSFLKAIRAELPDDGIFVDEVTQLGFASRLILPVYQPRTFISPGYQGTLGWGFATALGVKVAHPNKAVALVTGDGGFMFTVQELATAVQHKIGLVTLIFNDGAFGNVRRMQKEEYGNRLIASDLHNPDFVKMAESYGAQGLRAHTPEALRLAIRQGLAQTDVPTLIDIPVGEMPSPWPLIMAPHTLA